jgi:hypothetical protein
MSKDRTCSSASSAVPASTCPGGSGPAPAARRFGTAKDATAGAAAPAGRQERRSASSAASGPPHADHTVTHRLQSAKQRVRPPPCGRGARGPSRSADQCPSNPPRSGGHRSRPPSLHVRPRGWLWCSGSARRPRWPRLRPHRPWMREPSPRKRLKDRVGGVVGPWDGGRGRPSSRRPRSCSASSLCCRQPHPLHNRQIVDPTLSPSHPRPSPARTQFRPSRDPSKAVHPLRPRNHPSCARCPRPVAESRVALKQPASG